MSGSRTYDSLTWTTGSKVSPAGPINGPRLQHMDDGIQQAYELASEKLTLQGDWTDTVDDYLANDVVFHNGGLYVASAEITDNSEPGTESPWLLIGLTSVALAALTDVDDEDKADGKVLTYISDTSQWEARVVPAPALTGNDFLTYRSRGNWASETSYSVGDYVKGSDSAPYVAIAASTDNDPTNEGSIYWVTVPLDAPVLLRATDATQTNPGSAQTPAAAGSIMLFAVGGAFQLWKKDDGRDFAWSQALVAGTHLQVSNGLVVAVDNDGTLTSLALTNDTSQYLNGAGSFVAVVPRNVVTTSTGAYDMGDIGGDTVFFYSGTGTLTVPAATDGGVFKITVKNVGSGIITIAARGDDTIDGVATKVLDTQNQSVDLISNGTDGWWIV